MTTPLTLDTADRSNRDVTIIAVGEIDQSNIDAFDDVLATTIAAAAADGHTLTIDLSHVEYLDSAAINVLFAKSEHVDHLVAHSLLMPILAISGISDVITTDVSPPGTQSQPN